MADRDNPRLAGKPCGQVRSLRLEQRISKQETGR
jgi:hypothetical protein